MKNLLNLLLILLVGCVAKAEDFVVKSPNQQLELKFWLENSKAYYSLSRRGELVLEASRLGIKRQDVDFSSQLSLTKSTDVVSQTDSYTLFTGKKKQYSNKANQQTFVLKGANGELMEIEFNVFNDGVAFRYHFPAKATDQKIIEEEQTTFNFPESAKAWLQPMSVAKTGWEKTNPSYEEYYHQEIPAGTPSFLKAGWVFPALFKVGENWALITETFPEGNYCGSRLSSESPEGEYQLTFPDEREVIKSGEGKPKSALPWYTPWRIVAVGDLKTIVESSLGTDLAKPSVISNTDFIKPGISSWSWALLKDNFTTYPVQKKFIDYAAKMKWSYCLIDADWDRKIGREKIEDLSAYAKSKGIGLILWYNSAGDWNSTPYTPRDKMLTDQSREAEFSWLESAGIKGVKVDFFGGDGQSNMQYYRDILESAAKHHILVNFHGATLPRGLQRTYPNLVTVEAIKGLEFRTFEQNNENVQATHCAMLPFTRNVFDPMDYTPMVLDSIPNIRRSTTAAFELALPVLFLSGVQHIAEIPEGMAKAPAYVQQLLSDFPKQWDESRFLTGYPGKFCVIARRAGDKWYVAGINGENIQKDIDLDLSFLQKKEGILIQEGGDALGFSKKDANAGSSVKVNVDPNSGFVMVF